MTEEQQKAIESIAEAAVLFGWSIMLHQASDPELISGITIGNGDILSLFDDNFPEHLN